MHIIIGILGLAAGAYFWWWRLRNAADMASDVANAANDVRLAARRFGFKRKTNLHPVESVEDTRVAAAGVLSALLAQDTIPSAERRKTMLVQMQSVFGCDKSEAEELALLGHWLVGQCGTPSAAVSRLSRRLAKLAGAEALPDLERIIQAIYAPDGTALPDQIRDAMTDIKSRFRKT